MRFDELTGRVASLPGVDRASVPYLVSLATDRPPSAAAVTLVAHPDGSFSATFGDLRDTVTTATDDVGRPLRFADEDAACEWAWDHIRQARAGLREYTPAEQEEAAASGDEIRQRMADIDRDGQTPEAGAPARDAAGASAAAHERFPGEVVALDEALVAYLGKGRRKIPTADTEAVRALDPAHPDDLLAAVAAAIRASDSVAFEEVAPFDEGLAERLYGRLRVILPDVGEQGIEALGWRWGFLRFGA